MKLLKLTSFLAALSMSASLSSTALAADHYQHLRNATGRLEIAGKTFLIDPMLADKGAYPGFPGTVNSQARNPVTALPMPARETFAGVDALIVTHTHLDHWDEAAQKLLPKMLPVFVQHEQDAALIRSQGFRDVRVLNETLTFEGVTLVKTGGAHGTTDMYAVPALAEILGDAMGVVLKAPGHKTIYIMGDTRWTADVNKALHRHQPDVLIMNTGDARTEAFPGQGIIMSKEDVKHAYQAVPKASIIAVHMDAVNHTTVSRAEIRQYVQKNKLKDRVNIPDDGERVSY